MTVNEKAIWLWLGFELIYFSVPEERNWKPLLSECETPWYPTLPSNEGRTILRHPANRLGLDTSINQLNRNIAKQIASRLNKRPITVFAPPNQLPGLIDIVKHNQSPIKQILTDYYLFPHNTAIIHSQTKKTAIEEDRYIPDWRNNTRCILRKVIETARPTAQAIIKPALLTVGAYKKENPVPISFYHGQSAVLPTTVQLTSPSQPSVGKREIRLGLIWAWGNGPRLWQWALKPSPLPEGSEWSLKIGSDSTCIVESDKGGNENWTLLKPQTGINLSP